MLDDIKKIIEISVRAPSGDNLQPWKFVVHGDTIELFIKEDPDKNSIYNFKNRGNYVGHGALIENIIIAASHFGYDTDVRLMPDSKNLLHTADISLIKTGREEDVLFNYIGEREVNRGVYHNVAFSDEEREELQRAVEVFGESGEIRFIERGAPLKRLAKILSTNEKLLFQNKELHDGLYKFLRWTQEEVEKTKDGLNAKRLGLNAIDLLMIRALKSWSVTYAFKMFGLTSIITAKAAHKIRTSSAICVIVAKGNSEKDFIYGGRIFQRTWLTVTKMDLALQPAFGLILLAQRLEENKVGMFSTNQVKVLNDALRRIKKMYNLDGETITMLFRIGRGDKVKVPSLRKDPEIIIEN